jgi:hypothetical protein
MLRWVFLLLAMVFGAGAAGAAYLAWRGEEARGLLAAKAVHDCGELEQGATIRHEFQFVNRMGETLKIKEIVKQCACTEARFEPEVLGPGERGTLSAVWEVRGARGKSQVLLTVLAAMPDESLVPSQVVFRGTVKPDIEYAPAALEFSASAAKQTIRFSPGRLPEFALKQVSCGHKAFSARIVPGKSEVEVTFQPSLWKADLGPSELHVETTRKKINPCAES